MKGYKMIAEQAILQADLPGESLPNQPILELIGEQRVLLENHNGVISYDESEIKVRVGYGIVSVSGAELRLANMTRQQLIIRGRIDGIAIIRKNGVCR